MIYYLFESTVCWLLFYGFYVFFLKKETFFQLNRYYLLGSLLGGLIIPLLEITPGTELVTQLQQTILLNEVVITGESTVIQATSQVGGSWLFLLLYSIGFVFLAARMLKGLSNIYRLKQLGTVIPEHNYTRIETTKPHAPFSFFRFLFLNKENGLSTTERNQVITHELAHIKGRHSLDVLLVELMTIILWFHPLIFLYKRSIKENHEFLADQAVLQHANRQQYSMLLVEQAIPGLRLANNFNHSLLKRRIKMMSTLKSKNVNLLKYLICIPMIGMVLLLFSCKKDVTEKLEHDKQEAIQKTITSGLSEEIQKMEDNRVSDEERTSALKKTHRGLEAELIEESSKQEASGKMALALSELQNHLNEKKVAKESQTANKVASNQETTSIKDHSFNNSEEIYKVVDEMPRFPGCESGNRTLEDRKSCAEQRMLQFIYSNIVYPQEARLKGIQGMAVVSFIVDKQGNITNPKILRGLEGGCNDEVLKVVNAMPKWIPGKQGGQLVDVIFNLPVRFKLQ